MTQEQIDTRKILEELASLKRKINDIEIEITRTERENENVLKETFGILKGKIKEDSQAMKDRLRIMESQK